MAESTDPITLRLEGARAVRGISLSDFESFLESFITALRDFDRDRRGEPTRKSGHPEARAEAVAAFRLVGFRPGSAVAELEPQLPSEVEGSERFLDSELLQVANLRALIASVEREEALPESVTDCLERAIRSAGEDGSLSIRLGREQGGAAAVRIDRGRIARLRAVSAAPEPSRVASVSGRLHRVDFEPDRLAIRASDGVDWDCSFPAALEDQVAALVNRLVWASGEGVLRSPRRGSMTLEAIRAVEQGTQTPLFTAEPVPDAQLGIEQGVLAPQGLDALAPEQWSEADDAYLRALIDE